MGVLRLTYGALWRAGSLGAAAVDRLGAGPPAPLPERRRTPQRGGALDGRSETIFPSQSERAALLAPFVGPEWTST